MRSRSTQRVCDHGLMLVWLTDWQLSEDHLLVRVGDAVEWTLYEADHDWTARLFGDRLALAWQFDTYGDAVDQPSLRVRGVVAELQSVRCRQVLTDEGFVPVRGEARLLPVADTSGSWMHETRPVHTEPGALYGYIVTFTLTDEASHAERS